MTYKIFFIIGLIFLLIGQIILSKGNDFVYAQEPIDFAHWFLLVGVVLLIPQVVSFPKKIFSLIGIPLTLIGITCTIGMCVLDFIWWSFPNEELRHEFTNHISKVPSIWNPFMSIGPSSKIFNLGLLILSLNYYQNHKIGIGIILIANLILWHIIPLPFRLVLGYALTLIGFSLIFVRSGTKNILE
ncbi:conserved hypothetical membrane protein [Formosa agariphila KMM 3901]|uniref:Conserved hypothetical membrane protein n=1 Tax=Formosa agariphila (strain DSM 15362 / KCTC 12365 / LMG 23005 / KMM 3901 / M-2Alg 35-1) TaxID=1347342 RepID=T2KKU1_FORAG|nr:hypothetical protein [Formosa agariphila]CDF79507.1 conserved hypothetical membrane protein [Formosa agariphila KMM 3901]